MRLVIALALVAWLVAVGADDAGAQVCSGGVCDLGVPGLEGVSVEADGSPRNYTFRVTGEPSTVLIYVGDLWAPTQAAVFRGSAGSACDAGSGCVASARSDELRTHQLYRPMVMAPTLEPGAYTLRVTGAEGPRPGHTVRLAVASSICGTSADGSSRYAMALSVRPVRPRWFDLLTFDALLSPPYSDLFDFDWEVDGRPVAPGGRQTLQWSARELGAGEHRLRVVARGARPYPDPDQPVVPPTVVAECSFRVS
jgi:hypothetical protein